MRMGPGRKRDFSPVPWSQYFESMEDVEVENETGKDTFRVYKSGSEGPVLLLLHGGGHSALSWAVFTAAIISRVQCRIVALDLRGHGETKSGILKTCLQKQWQKMLAMWLKPCMGTSLLQLCSLDIAWAVLLQSTQHRRTWCQASWVCA